MLKWHWHSIEGAQQKTSTGLNVLALDVAFCLNFLVFLDLLGMKGTIALTNYMYSRKFGSISSLQLAPAH